MAVDLGAYASMLQSGGAIITTSGGNIYVFAATGALRIFKSTDSGASFSELTSVSQTTIFGSAVSIDYISAAIDTSGTIHVVCENGGNTATRDVSYCTFTVSNDTWGTWEQAAGLTKALASYQYPLVSIAVDSNNKPHVLYSNCEQNMGNDYIRIYYTNKTGASWLTPEQVSTATQANHTGGQIVVRNSDIIEAFYKSNSSSGVLYRTRTSGSWGTESSLSNGVAVSQHSMTATTGGTMYRYATNSSSPYQGYENNTAIGSIDTYGGLYGCYFAAVLGSDGARYFIYTDRSDRKLKYVVNSGSGWSAETDLETIYTVVCCIAEWAYNAEYQYYRINYVFTTSTNIYYNKITLTAPSVNVAGLIQATHFVGLGGL